MPAGPARDAATEMTAGPASEVLLTALLAAQQPDGGWGFRAGLPSNSECTALAAWALHACGDQRSYGRSAIQGALNWLNRYQRPDGSWAMSEQVAGSSWMSGVVVLALSHFREQRKAAVRGAHWLLEQQNRTAPRLARVLMRLMRVQRAVDQDPTLLGWPWADATSAWVEPSAYALLALKRLHDELPPRRSRERIEMAELMLYDRMCAGGGWNYGNKRVLGVDLPPYPDTTALALLALQDAPPSDAIRESAQRLRAMVSENRSGLVLALAALCLSKLGDDVEPLRLALEQRFAATAFRGESRVLALAALALDRNGSHFGVRGHA